jgi:polysaccharide deacetylase family protein (PEP-CTERM system associated)
VPEPRRFREPLSSDAGKSSVPLPPAAPREVRSELGAEPPLHSGFELEVVRVTPPPDPAARLNAFTVDVEDWYQSSVDFDAPISERVVRNTERVLLVLDECGVKGTFFVQGKVAEKFPRLVASLVEQGHEVQAHGYSHRPLYSMDRAALRIEVDRAKKTVEDAAGTAVTAFRAQDFSILARNLWALETLAEAGFLVDSSIFPMRTRHYGIPGWQVAPHRVHLAAGGSVLEVPVAVWGDGRWRFPVAGGGYFRFLPKHLLLQAVRSISRERPAIVYCHPYEFSPDELHEYRGKLPRRLLVSQNLGRSSFAERVRTLLTLLPFGRFDAVLAAWGLT